MSEVDLKSVKAEFSASLNQVAAEELAMAPLPAEVDVLQQARPSLVHYLSGFPADIDLDDDVFARNPSPSMGFASECEGEGQNG
ncbi:hypothetical protein SAMN02982989_2518 [Xaviernesmea oryzae]|uniref:Uncharacterized protein n=1 Tax=Xaviernesmea oryzae TaxID=464029 RepID=A0A1X7FA70_9HYPH|nr:hypothetical protein [Xaviernesmea oryzae]SMF48209.1 hypothetical protein SAMN02982989_2518 [Xaviernesmea oryzae]